MLKNDISDLKYDVEDELRYAMELVELAKSISCNFVDARTTTKDYLGRIVRHNELEERTIQSGSFIISTCLRYEIYNCDSKQKHESPFFYVSGPSCIRRLLSVLIGLHSEIIGEKEISMQVKKSISNSYDAGYLDKSTFHNLQKLISISEQIRQRCALNSNENYSTIAADIFIENLANYSTATTIAIVGGGYMADKFFNSLMKERSSLKIKKIYWINRGTSQLQEYVAEINHLLDINIEVLDLQTGRSVLKEADAIFCALAKSPFKYSSDDYQEGSLVVDVSYPQVFSKKQDAKLVTIANTDFNSLAKNSVSRENIISANREIDKVISFLEENI